MAESIVENIDCLEAMAQFPDNYFDLAIVDPPYGIGENGRRPRLSRSRGPKGKLYDNGYEDKEIPSQEYFDELFRVSKGQIIWGVNCFVGSRKLPDWPGRIIWNKMQTGDFSDCELAFCSMHKTLKLFTYMWNGMMQGKSITEGHIMQGNKKLNEKRIHQCQKPVALYRWILKEYAKPGFKILDTHLGSGSSRIACDLDGFDFWGYEIDPKCFSDHLGRWKIHESQLKLF